MIIVVITVIAAPDFSSHFLKLIFAFRRLYSNVVSVIAFVLFG